MFALKTYKTGVWVVVIVAALCTAASFFAQYGLGMNPCPLCIFQRVGVMAVGMIALLAAILPSKKKAGKLVGSVAISIPALIGLGIAIRHRYIQGLPPDEVPSCGPGLNYMVDNMPFTGMIEKVLMGSGECASVANVLGVPLPIWSILFFSFVLILTWVNFAKNRS